MHTLEGIGSSNPSPPARFLGVGSLVMPELELPDKLLVFATLYALGSRQAVGPTKSERRQPTCGSNNLLDIVHCCHRVHCFAATR